MSGKRASIALCVVLAVLLLGRQTPAAEQQVKERDRRDPGAMTVDLVAARPLGLVATVAGAAVFVLSSPFSAMGGNLDEAWNNLVATPAEYTFKRPLGEFD